MAKYRKKPVVIEAIQWNEENTLDVIRFCEGCASLKIDQDRNPYLLIRTPEDNDIDTKHAASKNDYIIKGVAGEFYPCKPDIFEQTYEPV